MTEKQLKKRMYYLYHAAGDRGIAEVEKFLTDKANTIKANWLAAGFSETQANEQLKVWLTNLLQGEEWAEVRSTVTNYFVSADMDCMTLVNDYSINIFVESANRAAGDLVKQMRTTGLRTTWEIYNRKAVELLNQERQILPRIDNIDRYEITAKARRWFDNNIQKQVQNGIIRGLPIDKVAKQIENVTGMGYRSALRSARTARTGAIGAADDFVAQEAEAKGYDVLKEWISATDERTRYTHLMANGERVKPGAKFSTECRYPGDMEGPPEELWNCRCKMRLIYKGIND